MSRLERPDLTGLPAEVVGYIEALEQRLKEESAAEEAAEPAEPPTSLNLITISRDGVAKRTPRPRRKLLGEF